MGDLISRSALIEELNKMGRDKFTLDDWYEHWLNGMICALERIDRQPTAYDLDKVVEELQVEKKKPWIVLAERNGYARAIDIVKRGGKK